MYLHHKWRTKVGSHIWTRVSVDKVILDTIFTNLCCFSGTLFALDKDPKRLDTLKKLANLHGIEHLTVNVILSTSCSF